MLAYSSHKVSKALEAVRSADLAASNGFKPFLETLTAAEQERGHDGSFPAQEKYVEQVLPLLNQMASALRDCTSHDLALIGLIRAELLPAAERRPPFG